MATDDPLAALGREVAELIAASGFGQFAFVVSVMDCDRVRSTCGIEGPPILKTATAISAERFQREET